MVPSSAFLHLASSLCGLSLVGPTIRALSGRSIAREGLRTGSNTGLHPKAARTPAFKSPNGTSDQRRYRADAIRESANIFAIFSIFTGHARVN
jgi:hypothetical protein